MGIPPEQIQLINVHPPRPVQRSFDEVNRAQAGARGTHQRGQRRLQPASFPKPRASPTNGSPAPRASPSSASTRPRATWPASTNCSRNTKRPRPSPTAALSGNHERDPAQARAQDHPRRGRQAVPPAHEPQLLRHSRPLNPPPSISTLSSASKSLAIVAAIVVIFTQQLVLHRQRNRAGLHHRASANPSATPINADHRPARGRPSFQNALHPYRSTASKSGSSNGTAPPPTCPPATSSTSPWTTSPAGASSIP